MADLQEPVNNATPQHLEQVHRLVIKRPPNHPNQLCIYDTLTLILVPLQQIVLHITW